MTRKTWVLVFICEFLAVLTALLLAGGLLWLKLKSAGLVW